MNYLKHRRSALLVALAISLQSNSASADINIIVDGQAPLPAENEVTTASVQATQILFDGQPVNGQHIAASVQALRMNGDIFRRLAGTWRKPDGCELSYVVHDSYMPQADRFAHFVDSCSGRLPEDNGAFQVRSVASQLNGNVWSWAVGITRGALRNTVTLTPNQDQSWSYTVEPPLWRFDAGSGARMEEPLVSSVYRGVPNLYMFQPEELGYTSLSLFPANSRRSTAYGVYLQPGNVDSLALQELLETQQRYPRGQTEVSFVEDNAGNRTYRIFTPHGGADQNGDHIVSPQDIFDFLNRYFARTADFNQDGGTSLEDLFDFLDAYLSFY